MKTPKKATLPRQRSAGRTGGRNGTADTRKAILSAAARIFGQQGYDGASLQQIAHLAGVAQPLINYHFSSKEGLWREAVDMVFSEIDGVLQTVVQAIQYVEPIDQLRILVGILLRAIAKQPSVPLIILNETRHPSPRLEWLVNRHVRRLNKILDDILQKGRERGQIRDLRPIHFTNTILATISQICIAKPLYGALYPDQIDAITTDEDVEQLFRILLEGIRA